MKARQLSFGGTGFRKKLVFGGATVKGNPREKRAFTSKQAMHLVLKSSSAKGAHSFLKHQARILQILRNQEQAFGITRYDYANSGNHLHLVVRAPSRQALSGFLRALPGLISRAVLKAEKGQPSELAKKFWDYRPFTRILAWGRDYLGARRYVELNRLEISRALPREKARQWMAERLALHDRVMAAGFA